jgi:hypothetical protein
MVQNLLIAAAFSALPAIAFAQSNPHFVGEGDSPRVAYDAPSLNIVGSAHATVSGPSDQSNYETQSVTRTQAPPVRYAYDRRQNWQLTVNSKG